MNTRNRLTDYDNSHSRYSGLIYLSDFNTDYSETHNIASRIAADWRFDRQCQKNEEVRERRYREQQENGGNHE